jgi:hypothetical protein
MHEVTILIHTMLVVAYIPLVPLRKTSILAECPYKLPPQDHHGGRHFLHPVGAVANLNLLQEIARL